MLGCIQPMSSPMMNMMLGFCCAAAGPAATATPAVSTMSAATTFRRYFMPRLLPGARLRGRSLHLLHRCVCRVHAISRVLAQNVGGSGARTIRGITEALRRIPDTSSTPPARPASRDVSLATQDCLHRGHQLVAGAVLGDEAEGAGGLAPFYQLRIVVDGDEDDPHIRLLGDEGRRRRNAVELGHHDVGDDHVGMGSLCGTEEGLSVGDDGNHVEFRCEQTS